MIENSLKLIIHEIDNKKELLSPGMLSKHYSPKTRVLINQKKYIPGSGCLAFGKVLMSLKILI